MVEVGVVGAGVAAAGCCCALDAADVDADVTVLELEPEIGGRAATLRRERDDRAADGTGEYVVDTGANYLTDDDERVAALVREVADTDGLVDVAEPVYTFDADGTVSEGRNDGGRKWTYQTGLVELPRRLFDATDATIHRETHVASLRREPENGWTVVDLDDREWGPFDVAVLTPPAPVTARLLADAEWDADVRDRLVDAARSIPYRPIYSAVLGYEFDLDRPYYALVNVDYEHEVGWLAREECKPGHVPEGETVLVVQASPDWSREYGDAPLDVAHGKLAGHAADLLGDQRLAEPEWSDRAWWGAALPGASGGSDVSVDEEPIEAARERGLYCVGDWVAGEGRLHAAIRSGLEAGDEIAVAFGGEPRSGDAGG